MRRRPRVYLRVKRIIDVAVSALGLVIGAPVMALVATAVWRDVGFPVLFRQIRPGLHGQPFELIKFRTMREADPAAGPCSDGDRLTAFGRWLRSTSMDELPTLWNVLRGDMSLVGPRPLLVEYLEHYTADQRRRHDVRPGVTGLAQVRGRNSLSWGEKFQADIEYVDHLGPVMDARLIAATVGAVVRRQGIAAEGTDTMPPFTGAPPSSG